MKIIHIAHESVFIEMAYNFFNDISSITNHFVLVTNKSSTSFKFTHEAITAKELLSNKFIKRLENYDVMIIHQMHRFKAALVLKAPKTQKIVWIGWSCDYYKKECIDIPLMLPKTKSFYYKNLSSINFFIAFLRKIRNLFAFDNLIYKKAYKRVDIFSPVLPLEYELVKKNTVGFKAEHVHWNYGDNKELLDIDKTVTNDFFNGEDLLLGNSASVENNHIEAIDMLKHINLRGKKVLCPLSYGNIHNLNYLIKYGNCNLGDSFTPILNYMTMNDYYKKLKTCRYVIMNHVIQQGMGNIIQMIKQGSSIFLQKSNPVYNHLINLGFVIFDIQEIEIKKELSFFNLTEEQMVNNRQLINRYYSKNAYCKQTKKLVEFLNLTIEKKEQKI